MPRPRTVMAWGLLLNRRMHKPSSIRVESRCCARRSRPRAFLSGLLLSFGVCTCLVPAGYGSDVPEWPHEREERLSALGSQILEVQRELFRAKVDNDEKKKQELEKRMKELEKEQVKLLRANGQWPAE